MATFLRWLVSGRKIPRPAVALPIVAPPTVLSILPPPLVDSPGRYLLVHKLGAGGIGAACGTGIVYLARDQKKDPVALKRPRPFPKPIDIARFRQERELMMRIQHPNVVGLLGTGENFADSTTHGEFPYAERGPIPFLVMELLTGHNLEQAVLSEGPFPWSRARSIALQLCDALHATHAVAVVHRDVKPSNVLLIPGTSQSESVQLLDFGLAYDRAADSVTQPYPRGGIVGTVSYNAPEHIEGNPGDPRMDIYGLGILLFKITTGQLPFTGDTHYQIWNKHLHTAPPSVRSLRRNLPAQLDRIIRRALAKKPDDRYPDALEMKKEIETT